MKLTDEILAGMGFAPSKSGWGDGTYQVFYDQIPDTLEAFKIILVGKAHNDGRRKGMSLCEEMEIRSH